MCVRLCDGYYWPVSYTTTPTGLAKHDVICQRSCESPARLFYYRVPDGDAETMVDRNGIPYRSFATAFAYRAAFDQSCKCAAHPWEVSAMDRHRLYSLEALARKGSQTAAEVARKLRDRIPAHPP